MNERKQKLEALFEEALALSAPEQRAAHLDRACGNDADLRREVEELLRAAHQAGGFLAVRQGETAAGVDNPLPSSQTALVEQPGERIGRYKLLQKLGEGGMGAVWMAEQAEPVRRKVALKIIKVGMDTREVIARFEAERQALAMMDHSNIAKVLDGGATESGRPYFVMELVPGIRLTDYCDQNKLTIRERLELFTKVCHAVQHAHQKGVIHRDLKPSNILVTLHDGVPVPKVIDFGIAKATGSRLTDKTLFTQLGAVLGTPAYMSPEQAELSGLDIDTRSDIYSLGVLLYQLLTGKPPFDPQELLAAGLEQMCRTIREKEPLTPSARLTTLKKEYLSTLAQRHSTDAPKLVNLVRGDLDWIVMKCLEKDRQRRYETASGLAADIQRHLSHEPVVARPPNAAYRFQKLVRRNKLAFAAGAAVAAALLIGVVASTWQAIRASRAEQVQSGLRAAADLARSNEVRLRVQSETARRSEERQRRRAENAARRNEELAEFYRTTFRSLRPEIARGRDTTLLREVLDETATRLYGELTNQPGTRLDIARSLARTYEKLGEYGRSEKMYRLALQQAEVLYGRTNPYTGFLMLDVAIELVAQGDDDPRRLDEAETILREILAIKFVADPVNRMDPALTLDTLATVQKKRGDLTNAIATWRQALTAWHKEPGRTSELALIQFHLAENLTATKHYTEAAGFAEQALAHRRQHAPAGDDLDLAASLELVGYLAYQSGDRRRAAQHYTQGLNIRRAIYPRASREWHRALQFAGRAAQRGGDLVRAEQWMREDLSNCRQTPGSDSGRLSEAVDSLARVLAARRAAEEGVPLTREMMMIERKRYATNTARLALALAGDAELLVAFGAFAEAETVAREAVQLLETNATANPGRRALVRAALGWALSERAWAERAAHPKADSLSTDFARRARESEGLLQEALALRAQSGPAWLTADTQSRLGFAQVLTALTNPAVTEPGRATNWVEAESRLLRSQESLRSDGDVDLFFRRAALQRLARLYEAWDAVAPNVGQAAPAAEWNRKLQEFDNWISDSGGG